MRWLPHAAGWVRMMSDGAAPSRSAARSATQRATVAKTSSGRTDRVPSGNGHGIADAALELPHNAFRGCEPAAFSGLPHQDGTLLGVVHHGGHCGAPKAQRQALRDGWNSLVETDNRGCGETGPDVYGENVGHCYLGKLVFRQQASSQANVTK